MTDTNETGDGPGQGIRIAMTRIEDIGVDFYHIHVNYASGHEFHTFPLVQAVEYLFDIAMKHPEVFSRVQTPEYVHAPVISHVVKGIYRLLERGQEERKRSAIIEKEAARMREQEAGSIHDGIDGNACW